MGQGAGLERGALAHGRPEPRLVVPLGMARLGWARTGWLRLGRPRSGAAGLATAWQGEVWCALVGQGVPGLGLIW